jgi:hypothetical protein
MCPFVKDQYFIQFRRDADATFKLSGKHCDSVFGGKKATGFKYMDSFRRA